MDAAASFRGLGPGLFGPAPPRRGPLGPGEARRCGRGTRSGRRASLGTRPSVLPPPLAPLLFPLLLWTLSLTGCGAKKQPTPPPAPQAPALTSDGWAAFESGNMVTAGTKFDAAVAQDSLYGPAYVGQGWTRLSLAVEAGSVGRALASFDRALALQQSGAEVRSGRAAALLALGGTRLAEATAEARAARRAEPAFVFSHRRSLDVSDLHLISAFAAAGQADFEGAGAAADSVQASGIRQGEPNTWQVDGVSYNRFETAVLAFLQKMSSGRSG